VVLVDILSIPCQILQTAASFLVHRRGNPQGAKEEQTFYFQLLTDKMDTPNLEKAEKHKANERRKARFSTKISTSVEISTH
jgi:hypothetical protein